MRRTVLFYGGPRHGEARVVDAGAYVEFPASGPGPQSVRYTIRRLTDGEHFWDIAVSDAAQLAGSPQPDEALQFAVEAGYPHGTRP